MDLGSIEGASAVEAAVAAVGIAAMAGMSRSQKKAAKKKQQRAVLTREKNEEKARTEMQEKAEKDVREAAAEARQFLQTTIFIDALTKGEDSRIEVNHFQHIAFIHSFEFWFV